MSNKDNTIYLIYDHYYNGWHRNAHAIATYLSQAGAERVIRRKKKRYGRYHLGKKEIEYTIVKISSPNSDFLLDKPELVCYNVHKMRKP